MVELNVRRIEGADDSASPRILRTELLFSAQPIPTWFLLARTNGTDRWSITFEYLLGPMTLFRDNLSSRKYRDPIASRNRISSLSSFCDNKMNRILTTSNVSPDRGNPIIELSSQQGLRVFFFILLLYFVSLFNFSSQKGSLKPFRSFATRSFALINVTSINPLPVDKRLDISDEAGSASRCVRSIF